MAMESMCICGNSHSSCKLEISMVKAKVFNSVSLLSFQKQVCLLSSSYHSLRLAIKIETVSKNMTTITDRSLWMSYSDGSVLFF